MFDQLFNNVFTGTTINPASMFGAIGVACRGHLIFTYKSLSYRLF